MSYLPKITLAVVLLASSAAMGQTQSMTAGPDAVATALPPLLPLGATNTVVVGAAPANNGIALVPSGSGALSATVPDGTLIGGGARGTNSVDWQGQNQRTNASMTASGPNATIGGGKSNLASGSSGTVAGGTFNAVTGTAGSVGGGSSNSAAASFSTIPGGNGAITVGYGQQAYAAGEFATQGDAQISSWPMRAISTSTGTTRLTSNGGTAGTTTCVNVPANKAYAISASLVGRDVSNVGNTTMVSGITGLLDAGASVSTTVYTAGAGGTVVNHGTGLAAVPSIVADTTLGCLNFSVIPPNTDTWHWVAHISTVEVQ